MVIISAAVFAVVFLCALKAAAKICQKDIAQNVKKHSASSSEISRLTAKEKQLRRHGVEHYIGIGNFQRNIGKYLRVIATAFLYVSCISLSEVIFSLFSSQHSYEFSHSAEARELSFRSESIINISVLTEISVIAVVALIVIIGIFGTFNTVLSCMNSNLGVYAIMYSAGSSSKSISKTIRKESLVLILSTIAVCAIGVYESFWFFSRSFGMTVKNPEKIFIILSICVIVFIISVLSASFAAKINVKKADFISTLKEMFY